MARQTKNVLSERNGLNDDKNKGKAIFYTNSNPIVLKDILNNKYEVISKDF